MTAQLAMFDPPYVKSSATSKAASESMVVAAASLRGRILRLIIASAQVGLTCDAAEEITSLKHQTVSARIRELVQLGKISIALNPDGTERTRPTRSGRQARVYVARQP